MARKPRLSLPNIPYHVIQRGNNKNPIFYSQQDYNFFLEILREAKYKYPCFIYGYCLMTNHFHLLVEPKQKDNLSLLMKLIGAKYVHYVNKTHNRTGTLWEGRFKSCAIDDKLYFLRCIHYIEANPIRAGIVSSAECYCWSSYRFRAFGHLNTVLDLDKWYNMLADNREERQISYRKLFQELEPSFVDDIRNITNKCGILGNDEFKAEIEQRGQN